MSDMLETEDFKCPEHKCFLSLIYPNSDASLACDSDCYFSKGEDGEKHLKHYKKKHSKEWNELNNLDTIK